MNTTIPSHIASLSPLTSDQRVDWLRLIRSENVGPVTFYRLLERFGSAANALQAIPELARAGGRKRPIVLCTRKNAERELVAAQAVGATMICAADPTYSPLLRQLDDAPPCLYAMGHLHLLQKSSIGIVGARNASASAKQFTRKLAYELGFHDLTVISGLARGIDTAAHEGSLKSGTVAVMAGGADVVYPPENKRLHDSIVEQGLVVSEMPPGTEPQARHFPRRNRIVSGLSWGVIVVEASARSGSLITARFAADQGRDVFAVPGSPLDPRCEGPNSLLHDGAMICRGVHDVLDQMQNAALPNLEDRRSRPLSGVPSPTNPSAAELEKARKIVLSNLSVAPVMVDEIIRQCQLSPSVVSLVLLELDLAGRLDRRPGHRVCILPET